MRAVDRREMTLDWTWRKCNARIDSQIRDILYDWTWIPLLGWNAGVLGWDLSMWMVNSSVVQWNRPGADTIPSPCVDEEEQFFVGWRRPSEIYISYWDCPNTKENIYFSKYPGAIWTLFLGCKPIWMGYMQEDEFFLAASSIQSTVFSFVLCKK